MIPLSFERQSQIIKRKNIPVHNQSKTVIKHRTMFLHKLLGMTWPWRIFAAHSRKLSCQNKNEKNSSSEQGEWRFLTEQNMYSIITENEPTVPPRSTTMITVHDRSNPSSARHCPGTWCTTWQHTCTVIDLICSEWRQTSSQQKIHLEWDKSVGKVNLLNWRIITITVLKTEQICYWTIWGSNLWEHRSCS